MFVLAVPLRVIKPVVDDPVLPAVGVNVQAIDHPDAFDQPVGVATVLKPSQINMMDVILVDDGVIENETTIGGGNDIAFDVFPNQA